MKKTKTKTMFLGAVVSASNGLSQWKAAVANFIVTFLVQAAFKLNDIINLGRYPSEFEMVQVVANSLIITLIFYGYNKISEPKKETS